jgi:hypothetical protein
MAGRYLETYFPGYRRAAALHFGRSNAYRHPNAIRHPSGVHLPPQSAYMATIKRAGLTCASWPAGFLKVLDPQTRASRIRAITSLSAGNRRPAIGALF